MKVLFVVNEGKYFLSHRLELAKTIKNQGWQVHVAIPGGDSVQEIYNAGFIPHLVPLSRRGINPSSEFRCIAALVRLYREIQPEIVHHLTIKPILYGGIASRRARVPAVIHAVTGLGHVFSAEGFKPKVLRIGVVLGYKLAVRVENHHFIFQNPDDEAVLRNHGIVRPGRSTVITGSGVDTSHYKPAPEPSGPPTVICASRMLWSKGVGEFVEAARTLKEQGIKARFVLVGDTDPGNPAAIPKSILESWSIQGPLEWWGWRDDMKQVFRDSHIFCLPTKYGEGVPKVLIEAAASGRPCITTDTPGCREIVNHEENGLLVPSKDSQALASAMKRLIEDPSLRKAMGAAGRDRAVTHFDVRQVIEKTLQVYEDLLMAVPEAGSNEPQKEPNDPQRVQPEGPPE